MKLIRILFVATFLIFLSSCVEINEDININKNGSGEYSMNMDMSKLLELMQNYLGKEEMQKQIPQNKMDTTIHFRSFVDTATNISLEKKALLREGKLHMDMNIDEKIFKTDMHFPFKNMGQLEQLYSSMGDGSLGTGQLLKGLAPGKNDSSASDSQQSPDFGQFNNIYTFTSRNGFLSRKVNTEKFNALKESAQYAQMKQAGDMGMEIPYTVTIHLPKPAKSVGNSLAKLSDDKKTVTIKYNLTELLDHPEKFEYSIEY
ncbi:MAG: hypothetical protein JST58_19210 [Bacteroidetes bacterium]|jgi:hypothetical protein|nr:hypothetical protein [Bacteroidota bacterium]